MAVDTDSFKEGPDGPLNDRLMPKTRVFGAAWWNEKKYISGLFNQKYSLNLESRMSEGVL